MNRIDHVLIRFWEQWRGPVECLRCGRWFPDMNAAIADFEPHIVRPSST